MRPPVRLRPLAAADLPLVRSWLRDAPEAPRWSDAELGRLIAAMPSSAPGGRLRRAWLAERVWPEPSSPHDSVGFVVASGIQLPEDTAECELEFLFVAPDRRRNGFGRMLVDAVLVWAGELGAQQVWLEVRTSNHAGQSLYLSCGFTATGSRPGYYANPLEDALLMQRQLRQDPPHRPV
ncbi:MAG: ribosomal-protein-alanine acetyltransferase [Acidobacteriaceae bacterium]|nr:ribosomal-protein-alanine acetyltransferase [Acidobacteriaceae bacterium]